MNLLHLERYSESTSSSLADHGPEGGLTTRFFSLPATEKPDTEYFAGYSFWERPLDRFLETPFDPFDPWVFHRPSALPKPLTEDEVLRERNGSRADNNLRPELPLGHFGSVYSSFSPTASQQQEANPGPKSSQATLNDESRKRNGDRVAEGA